MKLLKTSTVLLVLAAGLFFSCKKNAKGPEIIICPPANFCVPVKYIGNGCEDVIQLMDSSGVAGLRPYLTQWRNEKGELINNAIGAGHLPTIFRDGNIFHIAVNNIDSNKIQTTECLPIKFSIRYYSLGKDKCVIDSTLYKQMSAN
ncbi:hypothetical protein [Chitinophaga sp. Cy-1792]|uniref:hypothetical protein n=1 Tax=Chitinophaga sp. Cy-1792 TaxID=2608339 RepID=UPI0014245587|nr:hypothetical protein [Chitinophaga sp. Cy-1792]NIG55498.1 hypothetical protein [Chitinophaga sp. Cy-1792]